MIAAYIYEKRKQLESTMPQYLQETRQERSQITDMELLLDTWSS